MNHFNSVRDQKMPTRKRLGQSDQPESIIETEEKLHNLESEYNELNTK